MRFAELVGGYSTSRNAGKK
jgi:hypothetical protein